MERAPRERDRDERELDEQHPAVRLLPQRRHVRQAQDAEVDSGRHKQADQHRREL
jgi:hypothetical protein